MNRLITSTAIRAGRVTGFIDTLSRAWVINERGE